MLRVARYDDVEWKLPGTKHRGGALAFKRLLERSEGDADDYMFSLVRQDREHHSPRHCHNFDQFRYGLSGNYKVAPHIALNQGDVGYFPEGVFYGPEEGEIGRETLVIQFGGPSGSGYLGLDRSRKASTELAEKGKFEGGKFIPYNGSGEVDGYQAIWEHVTGESFEYPPARYSDPIIIKPSGFNWRSAESEAHLDRKLLGSFTECDIVAENRRRLNQAEILFERLEGTSRIEAEQLDNSELCHKYRLALLELKVYHELVRAVVDELGHVPDMNESAVVK